MGKYDGKVSVGTHLDNKGFEKGLGNVSGSLGGLKTVVGKLGGAIAAAFSVKAIIDFGRAAIELGSDLEEVQNVVDVSFGAMAGAAEEFASKAIKKFGMSELAAKQTASTYMSMAKGMGVAEGAASDMAITLAGLSGDVASFYNLDQEDAAKKLQGVFTGESEALKSLGVVMTQTNLKQFAMTHGMNANIEAMSQAELVALRYAFVTDALSLAAGDFERTQDSWANQTRILSMQWQQFMGIIGQTLTTVLLPTIKTLNEMVAVLANVAQKVQLVVAHLFGKSAITSNAIAEAAIDGTSAQEELKESITNTGNAAKKAFAGFDELNILQNNDKTSAATGKSDDATANYTTTTTTSVSDSAVGNAKVIEDICEGLEAVLVLVGLVGAGILAWKIIDAYTAGVSLKGVLGSIAGVAKDVGAKALMIAGAILLVKGYCDGWVNGINWGNFALTLGGIAAILAGVYLKFGPIGLQIGAVAASMAMLTLGVKDFVDNGPSVQNTILIIGGAIALAVATATMGLGPLAGAIIGGVAAVAAFTAAILLEKPAILSVEEAQENLTAAKEAAAAAENDYINAVDTAEAAMTRLKDAEEAAGIAGADLYAQVQSGTLDYADMTAAQKEVYKAYLDNEQKQKELEESTRAYNEAKKAETLASYENQLALAKESGNYDEFKKSVVAAFEAGELSADEARELIGKSMSEMSTDGQNTFMEDIPGSIKDGLDPNKYETTRKKILDFFGDTGKAISTWFTDYFWKGLKDFWNSKMAPIFKKEFWIKKFNTLKEGARSAFNGVIGIVENAVNAIIRRINTLSWDIPDWVPVIGGGKFGFNFKEIKIPRLAQGAVIPPNREFMAILGDQKHGTNVEAPLDTIKQALAEVLAIQQGGGETVIRFTGDLAQLGRVLKPVIEKEDKRVGGSIVRKAEA